MLQAINEEREDLRIVTLDVDANLLTAGRYGVQGLPTLILFRAGEPVAKIVGAQPKSRLLAQLEPVLAA